jgi:hypothetical protein
LGRKAEVIKWIKTHRNGFSKYYVVVKVPSNAPAILFATKAATGQQLSKYK